MSLSPLIGAAFHGDRVFVPFKYEGQENRVATLIRSYDKKVEGLKYVSDKGIDIPFKEYSKAKSKVDAFDLDLSRISFSRPASKFFFNGIPILPQTVPTEMKRYCDHHDLKFKKVKNTHVLTVENGLFFGTFGAISVRGSELTIVALWKPFVLTFFGAAALIHHEFSVSSDVHQLQIPSGVMEMQITQHRVYHGAMFNKESIVEMITNKWHGSHQLVVSKPYVKVESMFNVAVVHKGKWICVVCEKAFDEPVKWAQHFHHPVILNYSDTTWKEVRVVQGNFLEGNVYKHQIACPCSTHIQKSLMVGSIMNPKHEWFQQILNKAIAKATSTAGPFRFKDDVKMLNTNPSFCSWEDIGISIKFLVELDRCRWEKQLQWSLQFKSDHSEGRNVALTYEESQKKRASIEKIRRVAGDITKRYTDRHRLRTINDIKDCGHSSPKKRRVSE